MCADNLFTSLNIENLSSPIVPEGNLQVLPHRRHEWDNDAVGDTRMSGLYMEREVKLCTFLSEKRRNLSACKNQQKAKLASTKEFPGISTEPSKQFYISSTLNSPVTQSQHWWPLCILGPLIWQICLNFKPIRDSVMRHTYIHLSQSIVPVFISL